MPLTHSGSHEAFIHNLKAEKKAGKPMAQSLAIAYETQRRAKRQKMAHGGEAGLTHGALAGDIVDRIMSKRQKMSEGGVVANEGEDELDQLADSRPNEFDDLVLDDHLESKNSGAVDGDNLGNDQEDKDRADIVARIMRQRSMKHRMPRPA